jgi:ribonuclease VapC
MIVDTSAIIAVVNGEADASLYAAALADAPAARISAANWLEAAIVADARFGPLAYRFDALIADAGIEVVPVTPRQADLARAAYRRFGKGNHPAGLTFGDCFAYALAAERGEPLLFKGNDFAQTDVTRVI